MSAPVDVSTLRSLALQTKKRKANGIEVTPRTSVASNIAANLNSGSPLAPSLDDGSSLATKAGSIVKLVPEKPKPSQASSKTTDVNEDREDGEISEDDAPLAPPKPASPTLYTPNIRPLGMPLPTMATHNKPSSSLHDKLVPPPLPLFPRPPSPTLALEPRFPPPSPALLEVINKPVGPRKKKTKIARGPKPSIKAQPKVIEEPQKIDPVKAGADELQISEEEYAESRTLLIELLSWGVEPEYFVTQGFSRKALLVYCRDLKIRLPTNLPPAVPLAAENQEEGSLLNEVIEKPDSSELRIDLLDRISMQDQILNTVVTSTVPSTSTPPPIKTNPTITVEKQVDPIAFAVGPTHEESNAHLEKPSKKKKKRKTSDIDVKERTDRDALASSKAVTSPAAGSVHTLPSIAAGGAPSIKKSDLEATTKPLQPQHPPPPPSGPPPPLPVEFPILYKNNTPASTSSEPLSHVSSSDNQLHHFSNLNLAYPPPPSWNHHGTTHSPLGFYPDQLVPIPNPGTFGSYANTGPIGSHPFYPQHQQQQQQIIYPDPYAHLSSAPTATYGFPSPGLPIEVLDRDMTGPNQFHFTPSISNSPSAPSASMDTVSLNGTPKLDSKEPLSTLSTKAEQISLEASEDNLDSAPSTSTNPAVLTEVDLTAVEAHRRAVLQARKALLLEKKRMEEDKRTELTLSERLREKKEEVARREKELARRLAQIKAAKGISTARAVGSALDKAALSQPSSDLQLSEDKEKSGERMVMSTLKKTTKTGTLPPEPVSKEVEIIVLSDDNEEGEIEEGEVREDAVMVAEETLVSSPIPESTPLVSSKTSVSVLASAPPLSSSAPSSPRLAPARSLLGPKQLVVPPRRSASAHKRPSALDFDHKASTTFGYPSVEGTLFSKPKPLVPEQAWRFVIDISDCEASDEEDGGVTPSISSGIRSTTSKKSSATATAVPSPPGNLDGASTVEADIEAKSKLEAKESEIRRMVELIATMEKKQRAKLAPSASTSSLDTASSNPQSSASSQSVDSVIGPVSNEMLEEASSTRESPVSLPTGVIVDKAQEMLRTHQLSSTAGNEVLDEADGKITGAVEQLEVALEQRKNLLQRVEGMMDADVEETTRQDEREEDMQTSATTSTSDIVIASDSHNTGPGGSNASLISGVRSRRARYGEVNGADCDNKIQQHTPVHVIVKQTERTNFDYPSVTYTSPLAFFPLLMPSRSEPTQNQSESIVPALRTFCLSKRHLDPSRALCQWELQGGSCSDVTCQFTHWKDIEPTDDEIAAFLLERFGPTVSAEKVQVVVRAARESSTRSLTFADVAQRASTLLLSLS